MKAILLATFLTAAFVGLMVGQLADTGTLGSSQAARRAAVHLKRRLEEGTEIIEEEGAVRRTPELFILLSLGAHTHRGLSFLTSSSHCRSYYDAYE